MISCPSPSLDPHSCDKAGRCSRDGALWSGMTISEWSTSRSMPVMMSSITHSWAPTRTRRITAGSSTQCESRPRSSISSALRPGRYQPITPTFIVGWYPERLRVRLAFGAIVGASAQAGLPAAPERRYALREVKCQRRREDASAGRSKTASGWDAKGPHGRAFAGRQTG
jgi:hypothetical protein